MASVPFVDDEEEQKDDASLYAMDPSNDSKPEMPANEDEPQRAGQDGDGQPSKSAAMPQYTPQQSGSTNPENTSPALSGRHSSGADPLAGSLYEPPPEAPAYRAPDRSQRDKDQAQLNTDSAALDQSKYKPSVGRRIAGALAGISDSFARRPQGSEEDILNGPYAAAQSAQKARQAADETRLKGDQQGISDAITDSDKENDYYKTGLEGYKAGQEAKGQQWSRDRTNRQDTQTQTNWTAEDTERKNRDLYEETHGNNVARETVRHDRATEGDASTRGGYEDRRVSVEEQRLKDDENSDADGVPRRGSASDQRVRAQNEQKYRAMRKNSFDTINFGDPKAADEYHQKGYQQSLKDLQTSPDNDGEAWKPGEREDAIKRLNQQHVSDLNDAEQSFVENMQGMGFRNIQPIQFNDRGEATTDSSGRPLQRQQVGGAGQQPANPGQAGGGPQGAVPPAQAPQTFKAKSGQQVYVGQAVTVGGKPMKITGFNQQTGKPTVAPVAGQ